MSQEAGAELDRIVAEAVMGLDWGKTAGWWFADPACGVTIRFRSDAVSEYDNWKPWAPSTNIAHAWEVVERMATRGVFISVGPTEADRGESVSGYEAHAYGSHKSERAGLIDHEGYLDVTAETAPMAICKAALAALKAVQS